MTVKLHPAGLLRRMQKLPRRALSWEPRGGVSRGCRAGSGEATTGGEASGCASLSLRAVTPLTAAGAPGPRGGARPCLWRFCLCSHYPTYRPVLVSEARSTPRNTLLILGDAGRESSFLLSVVLHYSPCPARGVGTQTPRGGGSEQNRKQS